MVRPAEHETYLWSANNLEILRPQGLWGLTRTGCQAYVFWTGWRFPKPTNCTTSRLSWFVGRFKKDVYSIQFVWKIHSFLCSGTRHLFKMFWIWCSSPRFKLVDMAAPGLSVQCWHSTPKSLPPSTGCVTVRHRHISMRSGALPLMAQSLQPLLRCPIPWSLHAP